MIEDARRALVDFMEKSRKTQRQIAKETDLSTTVISQFLSGSYPGDNTEVAKIIDQYLTIGKERLNNVSTSSFYPDLYNTREVLFACNYAHRRNDVALVSGHAGAGKTTALNHYANTNTGVILITADAMTTTSTAILGLVCKSLGRQVPGRRAALMNTLVGQLADTNRLLIVDEADFLTFDALQAVRTLNDLAHIGIVFSGNDRLYSQMRSGRRSPEFEQLRTRIFVRKKVFNEYTVEEMEAIFPGLSQECVSYLLKLSCGESLRTARKLHDVAREYAAAKGHKLSAKHLKDTQKQLLGEILEGEDVPHGRAAQKA